MLCTVRMISVEGATELPAAGVCLVTFHWLSCCTADPSSATNVIFEKPAPLRVVSASSPILFVTSGTVMLAGGGGAVLVGGGGLEEVGGGGGGCCWVVVEVDAVVGGVVVVVPLSRLKM